MSRRRSTDVTPICTRKWRGQLKAYAICRHFISIDLSRPWCYSLLYTGLVAPSVSHIPEYFSRIENEKTQKSHIEEAYSGWQGVLESDEGQVKIYEMRLHCTNGLFFFFFTITPLFVIRGTDQGRQFSQPRTSSSDRKRESPPKSTPRRRSLNRGQDVLENDESKHKHMKYVFIVLVSTFVGHKTFPCRTLKIPWPPAYISQNIVLG